MTDTIPDLQAAQAHLQAAMHLGDKAKAAFGPMEAIERYGEAMENVGIAFKALDRIRKRSAKALQTTETQGDHP